MTKERYARPLHYAAMTLENSILERLGHGPVRRRELHHADPAQLDTTLTTMAARRQICMKADQVSLFWHRHMIVAPRPPLCAARGAN